MRLRIIWKSSLALLRDNPFFVRRVRSYLRGNRFYLLMTGFVLLVCLVLGAYFQSSAAWSARVAYAEIASLGRQLFLGAVITQAVVICLMMPLLTATVVASEKEKQTFDLLKLTTVSTATLVGGEILAAVAFLILLLLAALPVVGLVLLVGGVSPLELLTLYLALLLTGLVLSALGLFISATHDKVSKALSSAIGALFLLSLVLSALLAHPPTALLGCFNPLVLIAATNTSWPNPAFFWGHLPLLPAVLALTLLATLLMATLAARKVYNPGGRALAGWQMAIVFYTVLFLLIAGAWPSPGSGYLNCLLALFFLLLVFVMNQAVHPGSREAERLRGRKGIRPDSLPLLWLHILLGNAAIILWLSQRGVAIRSPTVGGSALVIFVVLTAYWALVRLVGLLSRDRGALIRNAFLLVILLLALPPLVGVVGLRLMGNSANPAEPSLQFLLWTILVKTNPIIALLELQSRLSYLTSAGIWDRVRGYGEPWLVCCVFHGILLCLLGAATQLLQPRRAAKTPKVVAQEAFAPGSEPEYGG